MHRGVSEFVRWMEAHRGEDGVELGAPAQARDVQAIESQLGTLLPADLRWVVGRFNGATSPSTTLLAAAPGPGRTIDAALKEVAKERAGSFLDPEALLPFARTDNGTVLAFDRSAAPMADAWPVVDFDPDSGEVNLVHRTFDGWCRLCVAEWTIERDKPFTLDRYLRQAQRHVDIEPDVSIAHVTLAHALKRAGRPEDALASYLRGARCVPAIPWADWEALKLSALLDDFDAVVEAGTRLSKRSPESVWEQRGTTPSRLAFVLARVLPRLMEEDVRRPLLLRALEHLRHAERSAEDGAARDAILAWAQEPSGVPPLPWPAQETAVATNADRDAWWTSVCDAYRDGTLRDDDLALDSTYDELFVAHDVREVLGIRREFA